MGRVRTNHAKQALKAGRLTAGAWLNLCSPIAAEIMGEAGFDWILIDMEHGHGDYQTLLAQLQALEPSESIPLVRVQWNDLVVIKRILDLGAYGVMIPWVNSRDAAVAAVQACRYPPEGVRGMAGTPRAAGFGRHRGEYFRRANEEVLVVIQVETAVAVEAIDQILSVPGIDVAFVGPSDLSASMGHVGNPSHPEVQAAIATVEQAAKAHRVALGTITSGWEQARELYVRGYQFLPLCSDASLVLQGSSDFVRRFRNEVAGSRPGDN